MSYTPTLPRWSRLSSKKTYDNVVDIAMIKFSLICIKRMSFEESGSLLLSSIKVLVMVVCTVSGPLREVTFVWC